ncbi:hypothetical protein ASE92_11805 [Pedobacter sp. Leaf41]|uniref:HNH endonuclease n=1 Tax=Pedobacter sp. Leaf41 TaxID=1736218 RepID=UPI0007035315|nr:HNH endonuclease [Pedobacter sp. Leaf41]KQN34289.1 hypothetical protein ASE92_11805 [Pedobacter sp. Leaf41]
MNGKHLIKLLSITALHSLYREDGKWYHHLKKFPGVLFDKNGYIIFATKEDYENNAFLIRQKDLHITNGISSLVEYKHFSLDELKKVKSFDNSNNKLEVSEKAWEVLISIAAQAQKNKEVFKSPIHRKDYFVEAVAEGKIFIKKESSKKSEIGKKFFLRVLEEINNSSGRIERKKIGGHVAKISAIVYLHPQLEWADNFETILAINNTSKTKLLEIVKSDIDAFEEENSDNFEGKPSKRLVNYYERKPHLRAKAILLHGTTCKICKFNFEKHYGEYGEDYIEVHHLVPISKLIDPTEINPETDMTVLCANCHRMAHRSRSTPLSVEELRGIWEEAKDKISPSDSKLDIDN